MTRLVVFLALAGAFVAASCKPEAGPNDVPNMPADHAMRVGESVQLEHPAVRVRLDSLADSRCPKGVQCIVAGTVVVSLTAEDANGRMPFTLSLSGEEAGSDVNAPTVEVLGHSLRVRRMDPYPVYGTNVPDSGYRLVLIAR